MPRKTEDQQDNKLSTLLGLTQLQNARQQADTESTGALVKMLGDLYGLSLVPEKIAQTRAETELAKQHADYYAAQQETPQTRQLYNTFQALQYAKFLGLPDEHIQPIARQALRNSGYDLPEPVKPRGEFGAGEATPTKPPSKPLDPAALAATLPPYMTGPSLVRTQGSYSGGNPATANPVDLLSLLTTKPTSTEAQRRKKTLPPYMQ